MAMPNGSACTTKKPSLLRPQLRLRNLHLINGPFDADCSNAPILAIASLILGSKIGTGYFQETRRMWLAAVANCLRVGSTRREDSI